MSSAGTRQRIGQKHFFYHLLESLKGPSRRGAREGSRLLFWPTSKCFFIAMGVGVSVESKIIDRTEFFGLGDIGFGVKPKTQKGSEDSDVIISALEGKISQADAAARRLFQKKAYASKSGKKSSAIAAVRPPTRDTTRTSLSSGSALSLQEHAPSSSRPLRPRT